VNRLEFGLPTTEREPGRGNAAFSLFMRFENPNRNTHEALEIELTYTKPKPALISNRHRYAFFSARFEPPLHIAPRRTIPRSELDSRSLVLSGVEGSLFSNRTENISREVVTCTNQTTSHFLIGTEIAFFPLTFGKLP
jgi:hypothetical protein